MSHHKRQNVRHNQAVHSPTVDCVLTIPSLFSYLIFTGKVLRSSHRRLQTRTAEQAGNFGGDPWKHLLSKIRRRIAGLIFGR